MAVKDELKTALKECLADPEFVSLLQAFLAPSIKLAVAEVEQKKDAEIAKRDRQICRLTQQLATVRAEANELDQYSRRNCLVISGVPERENEITDELVIDVAKTAGITVDKADIDRSHRIGKKKPGSNRQVIVKLTTFNKREQLYQQRKDLRPGRVPHHALLTAEVLSRTYIADSLTKRNSRTMFVARKLKTKGIISRAWTDSCVMKIRVRDTDPTRRISSVSDLHDIAGDDPDVLAALREDGADVVPDDDTPASQDGRGTVTRSRSARGHGRQ